MNIEQFISRSEGQWRSMRSGHSLAFQQFDQIISLLTIKLLKYNDPKVLELLKANSKEEGDFISPFHIKWESESDWDNNDSSKFNSGQSILIPIPKNKI